MIDNRMLLIALTASIALNSFFAGMLVSKKPFMYKMEHNPHMMVREDNRRHPPMPLPGDRMIENVKDLPIEYQDKILSIIAENRTETEKSMDNIHSVLDEMDKVLTADKFDEKTLLAVISKIDEKDHSLKKGMIDMTLNIAKILPDEYRIEFFKKMADQKRPPFQRDKELNRERGPRQEYHIPR